MSRAPSFVVALCAALIVACASAVAPADVTAPPTPSSGPEVLTPLIVTALAPDPVPVRGTDGRYHVAYELLVLNTAPRPATLTQVDSLAGDERSPTVGSLSGDEIVARSLIMGDYTIPPRPVTELAPGLSMVLILDDIYDTREAVPTTVVHRIQATFGPVVPSQAEFANNFPEQTTAIGGPVRISRANSTVIGPPLTGNDWVAVNACCELSPHRGAMLPLGGRINGSERYAVDWSRFDLTAKPIVDLTAGTQATFRGDPTRNESYFTFDQPVLAVADATVVTVVGDLPAAPPRTFLTGLAVGELGGNHIVLDLGSGVFAFYAHLYTGSPTVRVGDRVTAGQEIARTGNSGNTTESHLHFGLMDSPLPLTATNLPFEIDTFSYDGQVTPEALVPGPAAGPRTNELPLIESAVDFPTP